FESCYGNYYLADSYRRCQWSPSLLLHVEPASVVSWKTTCSFAPPISSLAFTEASPLAAVVDSMCTALPAHCGLIFFHFLPSLRLRKRLPASSRERTRLPCDTVAKIGRSDSAAFPRRGPRVSATT